MLMIGVIPLPALMNSIFGGSGSGSVNTPSISPRRTRSPGWILLHQVWRHDAAVHPLGRHTDQAIVGRRIRRQRIRAPVVDPVDDHAEPHVLTGLVAGPFVAGPDQHAGRFRALRLDALDLSAQLLGGPERIDHLEVVVGLQRAEQSAHRAQEHPPPPWDVGLSAAFSHVARVHSCTLIQTLL